MIQPICCYLIGAVLAASAPAGKPAVPDKFNLGPEAKAAALADMWRNTSGRVLNWPIVVVRINGVEPIRGRVSVLDKINGVDPTNGYPMVRVSVLDNLAAAKKFTSVEARLVGDMQPVNARAEVIIVSEAARIFMEACPPPSDAVYLAVVSGGKDSASLARNMLTVGYVIVPSTDPNKNRPVYFIPVSGVDDPLVAAAREMMYGRNADLGEVKTLDAVLRHLKSEDPTIRLLAAELAARNAMALKESSGDADKYAQAVLQTTDDGIRRRLAEVYRNPPRQKKGDTGGDILPADGKLLAGLLSHSDIQTADGAIACLASAVKRAEAVAPAVRAVLAGGEPMARHRPAVMRAICRWGESLALCRDELFRLARSDKGYESGEQDRVYAIQMALGNNLKGEQDLALELMTAFPKSPVFRYLAEKKVHPAVPAIIEAVRNGKLQWAAAPALAVMCITGRFDWIEFEKFDKWWAAAEKAGDIEAFINRGYRTADEAAVVNRLVESLASGQYKVRQDARDRLPLVGYPIPPALRDAAAKEYDVQVAPVATEILAEANARYEAFRHMLLAVSDRWRDEDRIRLQRDKNGKPVLVTPDMTVTSEPNKRK